MKKYISILLIIPFLLCGCTKDVKNVQEESNSVSDVKSIWIAYYELMEFTKDKNEDEFKQCVNEAFERINKCGFNTVTVQVRPCADAFYKSNYFPTSIYFNGKQGEELSYDPLSILCSYANKYKLKLEAWINPYRVSQDDDFSKLSEDNIALKWYESDDKKDYIKIVNSKIYFNPAYDEITELIVNGVKEIVENYNVYAIHFDDYFYPTSDVEFDEKEYSSYISSSGELSLGDWRRDNVSNMVKKVYKAIKETNSDIRFGISPAANIDKDYNDLYADIYKWTRDEGYVDYICPQIYFGFRNVYQPFMFTVKKWYKLLEESKADLYIGLPLYKANKVDEYAAEIDDAIKNEFVDNDNIISRQICYINKLENIKGYYIFSYSQLNDESNQNEVSNMVEAMQSNNLDLRQLF